MNIKRTVKILVMISGLAVGSYYGYQAVQKYAAQQGAIRSYGTPQDEAFIKNQFKENWYTLIATPTYDVDFMLQKKAPNDREPQFFGKMAIKMLYENNQPIGFITYYMQTSYQGDILFLVIGKDHRGKRHGEKLLNYAFDELKKQGAKTVKIFTRTENTSAQKLYTRIGFVETHRYTGEQMPKEGGVFYRKQL
jgi:ribosomal protein S18 acetylase RimI-like enzyme